MAFRVDSGHTQGNIDRPAPPPVTIHPADFLTIGLLVILEGLLSADNAMVLAVLVTLVMRRHPTPTLDPSLLAVAPFDVRSPDKDLAVWGEGLMDLLSRSLDAAGSIRTHFRHYKFGRPERHWAQSRVPPACSPFCRDPYRTRRLVVTCGALKFTASRSRMGIDS